MMKIRKGEKKDVPAMLELIKELAVYEKAPDEVVTTVEELEKDGFGKDKVFDFIVADEGGIVVGFALYYISYSTWKGRCLYLEDFLVRADKRGQGIGDKLFLEVVEVARISGVRRMDWQVLDWNEPALSFYRKHNAVLDDEWVNGRLFFNKK